MTNAHEISLEGIPYLDDPSAETYAALTPEQHARINAAVDAMSPEEVRALGERFATFVYESDRAELLEAEE